MLSFGNDLALDWLVACEASKVHVVAQLLAHLGVQNVVVTRCIALLDALAQLGCIGWCTAWRHIVGLQLFRIFAALLQLLRLVVGQLFFPIQLHDVIGNF